MDNSALGSVVGRLHLGKVDNVTTHRSCRNEAPIGEVGQFVAIDIGALLFLAAPVCSSRPSTVEGAIEINADHVAVVLQGSIDHGALGPGNTRVGNKHIQTAIEVLDGLVDSLVDGLGVCDTDLVGLGCK